MKTPDFSRRHFISAAACLGATNIITKMRADQPNICWAKDVNTEFVNKANENGSFSIVNDQKVRFYSPFVKEPITIVQITDSHLYLDDERGHEYVDYSARMSKAYNVTKHFKTGAETNPIKAFKEIADSISTQKADAIVLTGDILSFPSAAGVDYIRECLDPLSIPYYYISGNHDWHFEGLPGTSCELRSAWIEKRLKPLYPQNANPLAYSAEVKGIKLILIDDSIYEILPEQLLFLQKELSTDMPSLIFMHIPLYAPGRPVSYGVAHPNWNESTDKGYKIERRNRWPEKGHSDTTYAFRNEILQASNVLGVFAGHIHNQSLDLCNGKPLYVTKTATNGSTLTIEILPLPSR